MTTQSAVELDVKRSKMPTLTDDYTPRCLHSQMTTHLDAYTLMPTLTDDYTPRCLHPDAYTHR